MTTGANTLRRFYKAVHVRPTEPAEDGYLVLLDSRPVRTPLSPQLTLPTRALAEAVAEEWDQQSEQVELREMPLTQLAGTAQDRLDDEREKVVEELAAYGETDLVCHRAGYPAALVERQHNVWQPLMDWIELRHGVRLVATEGVMPTEQDPDALASLRSAIAAHDNFHLAALSCACHAAGSIVIGLALLGRVLDAEAAFTASQVDEDHQISEWGEEPELMVRRATLLTELRAAERMRDLLAA